MPYEDVQRRGDADRRACGPLWRALFACRRRGRLQEASSRSSWCCCAPLSHTSDRVAFAFGRTRHAFLPGSRRPPEPPSCWASASAWASRLAKSRRFVEPGMVDRSRDCRTSSSPRAQRGQSGAARSSGTAWPVQLPPRRWRLPHPRVSADCRYRRLVRTRCCGRQQRRGPLPCRAQCHECGTLLGFPHLTAHPA